MRKVFALISGFLLSYGLCAQVPDSLPDIDTAMPSVSPRRPTLPAPVRISPPPVVSDTILPPFRRDTIAVPSGEFWKTDSFLYTGHLYYHFTGPIRQRMSLRQWQGKEAIFYSMVGLLIFFGVIKNGFARYVQDLFKVFFHTTVRQRQIKEQLVQNPLPSLLLNIFFLISTGMFLALIFEQFSLGRQFHFWELFIYCVLGLMAIYAGKFLVLKFIGWALQVREAADAYIFIVFTTNKIIGMALLPFLVIMAFSYGFISQSATSLGIALIGGLLAYRYFLSYITIHRQIRISFFHFFIYLCALEIAPLLLINKLLFTFLRETS